MHTGFYDWVAESDLSGVKMDEDLALRTRELDPDGEGICSRSVRRIRYGERSNAKGIYLLMCATGLPFSAFLPETWVERVEVRR